MDTCEAGMACLSGSANDRINIRLETLRAVLYLIVSQEKKFKPFMRFSEGNSTTLN